MKDRIRNILADEGGATMVEYVFVLTLIAVAAVAGVMAVGSATGNRADGVAAKVTTALAP